MTKFPLSLTLVSTEAGETKVDVLRKIAGVSQTIGLTESKTLLFEALQAREASGNTMIAEDFALPHIESTVLKKAESSSSEVKKSFGRERCKQKRFLRS